MNWPELPPEIIAHVEALRDGRNPGQVQQEPADRFYSAPDPELSPRETDVLALIAEGLTDQQVGDRLYISLETVKTHVKNLLRKLEAANRAHAVAQGFRHGDLV